jgi:hypothetical protein
VACDVPVIEPYWRLGKAETTAAPGALIHTLLFLGLKAAPPAQMPAGILIDRRSMVMLQLGVAVESGEMGL